MSVLKNEKVLEALMYPITKEIKKALKKGNTIFISKFGNADHVLKGMDLISRGVIEDFNQNSILFDTPDKEKKALKKTTENFTRPVFYSITGLKGCGTGYLVEVDNQLVLVSANSEYLK